MASCGIGLTCLIFVVIRAIYTLKEVKGHRVATIDIFVGCCLVGDIVQASAYYLMADVQNTLSCKVWHIL
ncbi:hypothetical protein KIPB_004929 [Kipferlia bialata]|uniref:Uncharacterized protein n=1 Tax=Kipferlia bialata TaxID=797122 RepID=A0A9K3CXP3_9EUKA|nr:hypothetical protein KIPB_004929 [Kipferlia bialata]|eukprot:g4929.t1